LYYIRLYQMEKYHLLRKLHIYYCSLIFSQILISDLYLMFSSKIWLMISHYLFYLDYNLKMYLVRQHFNLHELINFIFYLFTFINNSLCINFKFVFFILYVLTFLQLIFCFCITLSWFKTIWSISIILKIAFWTFY